jgi:hypothetical protein
MTSAPYAAFQGPVRIALGDLSTVARAAKAAHDGGETILMFDTEGRPVELDLRGEVAEVLARLPTPEPAAARGPGRPKLGVTAREVTLLPRHWDWLGAQPGGASVTLRKLVEAAARAGEGPGRQRRAREIVYRFAAAMAGDAPGFEAAMRALFAGDAAGFKAAAAGPGRPRRKPGRRGFLVNSPASRPGSEVSA